MSAKQKKIGIFVIAYNAVNKLDWTLDRIPKDILGSRRRGLPF